MKKQILAIITVLTISLGIFIPSAFAAYSYSDLTHLQDENECIECDFEGADFERANLGDANLRGASLEGAYYIELR